MPPLSTAGSIKRRNGFLEPLLDDDRQSHDLFEESGFPSFQKNQSFSEKASHLFQDEDIGTATDVDLLIAKTYVLDAVKGRPPQLRIQQYDLFPFGFNWTPLDIYNIIHHRYWRWFLSLVICGNLLLAVWEWDFPLWCCMVEIVTMLIFLVDWALRRFAHDRKVSKNEIQNELEAATTQMMSAPLPPPIVVNGVPGSTIGDLHEGSNNGQTTDLNQPNRFDSISSFGSQSMGSNRNNYHLDTFHSTNQHPYLPGSISNVSLGSSNPSHNRASFGGLGSISGSAYNRGSFTQNPHHHLHSQYHPMSVSTAAASFVVSQTHPPSHPPLPPSPTERSNSILYDHLNIDSTHLPPGESTLHHNTLHDSTHPSPSFTINKDQIDRSNRNLRFSISSDCSHSPSPSPSSLGSSRHDSTDDHGDMGPEYDEGFVNHVPWLSWSRLRIFFIIITLIDIFLWLSLESYRGDSTVYRFTRVLRPFFLIERGRVLRQFSLAILFTLPPVLEIVVLIGITITTFGLAGFYLYSEKGLALGPNPFFVDVETSVYSMLILMSTANFPDVMMDSYSKHNIVAIFFIVYLFIALYLMFNMILAAVYSRFSKKAYAILKHVPRTQVMSLCAAFELLSYTDDGKVVTDHRGNVVMRHSEVSHAGALSDDTPFKEAFNGNNGDKTNYLLPEYVDAVDSDVNDLPNISHTDLNTSTLMNEGTNDNHLEDPQNPVDLHNTPLLDQKADSDSFVPNSILDSGDIEENKIQDTAFKFHQRLPSSSSTSSVASSTSSISAPVSTSSSTSDVTKLPREDDGVLVDMPPDLLSSPPSSRPGTTGQVDVLPNAFLTHHCIEKKKMKWDKLNTTKALFEKQQLSHYKDNLTEFNRNIFKSPSRTNSPILSPATATTVNLSNPYSPKLQANINPPPLVSCPPPHAVEDFKYHYITFPVFKQFIQVIRPDLALEYIGIIFHAMDISKTGRIDVHEWLRLCDFIDVSFELEKKNSQNNKLASPIFAAWSLLQSLVLSLYANIFIDVILFIQFTVTTTYLDLRITNPETMHFLTYICAILYTVEITLKFIFHFPNPKKFFCIKLNWFDFFIVLVNVITCILIYLDVVDKKYVYIINLRTIRIFRHLILFSRFRAIQTTMLRLFPALRILLIFMFAVYYLFGIIGVDLFRHCIIKGQMDEAFMETYYANNNYWENNFDTIYHAFVVLFEIMIINNWNLTVEGFTAAKKSNWPRVYFCAFFFCSIIICINVIVAMVLEAFINKYSGKDGGESEELTLDEMNLILLTQAVHDYNNAMRLCIDDKNIKTTRYENLLANRSDDTVLHIVLKKRTQRLYKAIFDNKVD